MHFQSVAQADYFLLLFAKTGQPQLKLHGRTSTYALGRTDQLPTESSDENISKFNEMLISAMPSLPTDSAKVKVIAQWMVMVGWWVP